MKKINLFLTRWENAFLRPFPLTCRQKEIQATGVAAGSSPGVDEVGQTLSQKGGKKRKET